MILNEYIGVILTNLRKKFRPKELTKGTISKSYLSNIENGNKYPGKETLSFLCERLEVEAAELSTKIVPNETILEQLDEGVNHY